MAWLRNVVLASLGAVGVAVAIAGSAPAADPVARCQNAIAREGETFFKKKVAFLRRCEDRVLTGKVTPPCPDATTAAKIQRAEGRKDERLRRACAGVEPVDLGWADTCPPPCPGIDTTTIDGLIVCVDCLVEEMVDELIDFYYAESQPEPEHDALICKRRIGKEAVRYAGTVVKNLNRCDRLLRKKRPAGSWSGVSPAEKVQTARYRMFKKISGVCFGADPQEHLGFGTVCPEVEGMCGGISTDSYAGLMVCIGCVSDTAAGQVVDTITPKVTVTTSTTTTSTTLPPGTDPALVCQRAIERGGMLYAEQMLQAIQGCAATCQLSSFEACLASQDVQDQLDAARAQWGSDTAAACATTNVHSDLGYLPTCGAAPSECTFPSDVLDAAGESNDLLDCLACHIAEDLGDVGQLLFANRSSIGACHSAIGEGGTELVRGLLKQLDGCLAEPGATSIAACFDPDESAWRAGVESACVGVDPFATVGYPNLCSGFEPTRPGTCALHALPCTFSSVSVLSAAGSDNDLLDCLTCRMEEAVLGVARQLHGANLCCVGETCDSVLTRFACREAGGTPVHYRIDTLSLTAPLNGPHGIDVGPDGWIYVADSGNRQVKKVSPDGDVTVIADDVGWVAGVAVDDTGDVYYTARCDHQVFKLAPSGQITVLAGTGVAGHSGDGGPATAAEIAAPDGIALDAAGNVYFTESSLLSLACPDAATGTERVRVVDSSGNIHTVAGGSTAGTAGEGGPALDAQLLLPYSLRRAFDGTLLIGEDGAMRVLQVDAGGMLTRVAGRVQAFVGAHSGYGGPAQRARFYFTCGLASDPDGNVIIGAHGDNRIALVDRLGSVIGIAGTGEGEGSPRGDGGPAVLAPGLCCEDVAVAADGLIYCAQLVPPEIRVLHRQPF